MEDKLIVSLSADIKDLKVKLNEAQGALKNYTNNAENAGSKASGGFNQITASVKNLVGAYLGLQAAQTALITSFNNSMKLEALSQAFTAIFGSAEQGERQLNKLRNTAETLGLEFSSLASAYKLFAGATVQSGMSIEQTDKIFNSVAKTSAVLKLSAEDTEGALRALAQMMGKGTVQAEELRGQLGERIPGAFKLAANAMGVTEQELGKMLEQGKVMSADMLPKLANELDKAFGSKVKGDIGGLTAEWNRFKNLVFGSTSGFSNFFAIILKGVNDFFSRLSDLSKFMADPKQFQADKAFNSLKVAIDNASDTKSLNGLINTFRGIQNGLEQGTPMWRAYTDAIIEAGKRIDEINAKPFNVPTPKKAKSNISFEMPSFDEQLKTADIDLTSLQVPQETINSLQATTNLLNEMLGITKDLEVIGGAGFEKMAIPLNSLGQEITTINSLQTKLTELQNEFNNTPINTEKWYQLKDSIALTQTQLDALNTKTTELSVNANNLVTAFGQGLTGAFEQALNGTQSFGKAFGNMLKQLIARILAAVAAAAALAALITIVSGGANLAASLGKLGIKGGFSGLLNLTSGGMLGGDRVVSAVGAGTNQGNVSFEIRGDKLYGVLKNYEGRLDRLQ